MNEDKHIEVQGVVTNSSNEIFSIELENGQNVRGYIAGKLRKNRIRVTTGDRVIIELSPYDLTKGRIIRRLN